jgi:hypothetical protein
MVGEAEDVAAEDGGEWARIRGEVERMGGWAVEAGIENPVTAGGRIRFSVVEAVGQRRGARIACATSSGR